MTKRQSALRVVQDQLEQAIAAPKCHVCGCLQQTVEALAATGPGKDEMASVLTQARGIFAPRQYDCLGCPICHPAVAANAFAEAYPDAGATLDLCPTAEPEERHGWPPLPGDYFVVRYGAPVAVCTLNSRALAKSLADSRPAGLSISGTMHTENLGIERVVRNILANPNIRFLVLCGEDTRQAVGHLPGQCFESLFSSGIDERGRIIGAQGKRPVLKNIGQDEVQAFLRQVELVSMIGEEDPEAIARRIWTCAERDPGPFPEPFRGAQIERIAALEPARLTLDPSGYFVVYPEPHSRHLVVEHYTNQGELTRVLEGASTGALYATAIERGLVSRLDHAAYLGRELARAERSLLDGIPFIQDAAPGDIGDATACADGSCGCSAK